MDDRRMEEVIIRREKNYIWLEEELKWKLTISTAAVAVLFLLLLFLHPPLGFWAVLFVVTLGVNGVWNYAMYRREYRNYLSIAQYLEEFEKGNYDYQTEGEDLYVGIHAQLVEQLERMGTAFAGLKVRLEEEKENTKRLVTDISHQLKTPISALELSLELLGEEKLTVEEKAEFLERSRREVSRLNHLLGTLTNLSRMEADMIQLRPKMSGLKETLVRAVNGIYAKAEDKQIEVEMQDFQDMELLHDSKWTAEAISNVLDNAVKYSPQGSKIQIRVAPQLSYIFVEIEDEGIGISREEYQNIFKRFYRGKRPEVEREEGAGVGLWLTRRILEEQGGSVRALSARNGGTVIQMMLPKKYEQI